MMATNKTQFIQEVPAPNNYIPFQPPVYTTSTSSSAYSSLPVVTNPYPLSQLVEQGFGFVFPNELMQIIPQGQYKELMEASIKFQQGANQEDRFQQITGGYKQSAKYSVDIPVENDWSSEWTIRLRDVIVALFKHYKIHQQFDVLSLELYKITQSKLLVAEPETHEQCLHRDGLSRKQWVVAFYLNGGFKSTEFSSYYHVPERQDIEQLYNYMYMMNDPVTQRRRKKAQMTQISEEEQKMVQLSLDTCNAGWDESKLLSVNNVPAGTISVFAIDKIHRGPANESKTDTREVIFNAFHPVTQDFDDQTQMFEYTHALWLYSWNGSEWLEAVDKQVRLGHNPLYHLIPTRKDYKMARDYMEQKMKIDKPQEFTNGLIPQDVLDKFSDPQSDSQIQSHIHFETPNQRFTLSNQHIDEQAQSKRKKQKTTNRLSLARKY